MDVALIDAGGANLASVRWAFERLGARVTVSADPRALARAERIVLPGVGAAATAMTRLRAAGLVEPLRALAAPLLGICLGMQLLFEASDEGEVEGLGLLPGRVRRLRAGEQLRVPHTGWNRLRVARADPLLAGIPDGAQVYFVHAYAAPVSADTVAACRHGDEFAAVVRRGHFAGAQFHPERSAAAGARLLENFLAGATA
jgi:glutamine amidotransferase